MFISNFNRFFEKHGKKTYIALGVVISAMFVVFVTPGSSNGGCGRSNSVGEMYGKTLDGAKMLKLMNEATVGLWMQNPQYFGYDLSRNNDDMLQLALHRMRQLHAVDDEKIEHPTKEEIQKYLAAFPVFQENDKFSADKFNNFLSYIQEQYKIIPVDFDRIVEENLQIAKLEEKLIADIAVEDSEIEPFITDYSLKVANFSLNSADSIPSEEKVKAFFNDHKDLLAKIVPQGKNASVAIFPAKAKVAADTLSKKFTSRINGESDDARMERFQNEAKKLGAKLMDTGYVLDPLDKIDGFAGDASRVCQQICRLKAIGDVTPMVGDDVYAAVAILKNTQPTPVPAELTEKISAPIRTYLMRTDALEYFKKQIKTPYDEAMNKTKEIIADTTLSQQDKTYQLRMLDAALPTDTRYFYVSETRDFAYVAIETSAFADSIKEITEDDLKAAFSARTGVEGKSFEDLKTELTDEIRGQRCHDEAVKQAKAVNDALRGSLEINKDMDPAVALKEAMANCKDAVLNQVENVAAYEQQKAPAEVLQAVFKTSQAWPTTGVVSGQTAVYVACLLKVTEAHLSDPETDDNALNSALMVYRRSLEMEAAKKNATAAFEQVKKELADGKKINEVTVATFSDIPAFKPCDMYLDNERIAAAENAGNLLLRYGTLTKDISAAAVGSVLPPVEAFRGNGQIPAGYNLVFLAEKNVVRNEKVDDFVVNYREMLLGQKRQEKLNEFYQKITEESNTYLYTNRK